MNSKNIALTGVEQSALSLIKSAVEHDNCERYPAALACYQEGIQLYLDVIRNTSDKKKSEYLRQKAGEYMDRAETVKSILQKQKDSGSYHEQIQIPNNGVGYSYETIFSKYLDRSVTLVEVKDPYIRTVHQAYNFLHFCEILVRFCPNLKKIHLLTGTNEQDPSNQTSRLQSIKNSLFTHEIELDIEFSTTLHDREIQLDNGWIIKIGRGLDIFKPVNKFAIGWSDQLLRTCHETTVDIYFKR